jgi:Zn-dependent protease
MSFNTFFWIGVLIVVIWHLPFLKAFWQNSQRVFRVAEITPARREDCPAAWQAAIEAGLKVAQSLGLEVVGYSESSPSTAGNSPLWSVTLQTPEQNIYLILVVNPTPGIQQRLVLNYQTYFADGSSLTTTNEKQLQIAKNPKRILIYLEGDNLEALYTKHCQALALLKEKKTPLCLSAEKFTQTRKRHYFDDLEYFAQIKAIDWLQPRKTYRLGTLTAIQLTWNHTQSQRQKPKANPNSSPNPTSNPTSNPTATAARMPAEEAQLKQQVAEFLAAKQVKEQRRSWIIRLGGLCLSLGSFVAIYAPTISPRAALLLVGVILLHELGQILAMGLFGYKDMRMLVIPFFGASTTARKANASLTERFWITLAGPLPGLILGLFLASRGMQGDLGLLGWLQKAEWQQEASILLVSLNLINLIPVYPLDGGQIVNLLLFSRSAYLAIGFQGLGILGLGLISLTQPLFLVFAALIAIKLPITWQIARTRAKLYQQLRQTDASDQESFLREVFRQFQQSPYRDWPTQKQQIITEGLLDSHREYHAPWSSRLGLMGIYLLTLLISFGTIFAALVPVIAHNHLREMISRDEVSTYFNELRQEQKRKLLRSLQSQQERQWQELNQELARNPQNVEAYLRRSRIYYHDENYQAALADVNYALFLNSRSIAGYRLRSQIYSSLGDRERAAADDVQASTLYWQLRQESGGYRYR